MKKQLILIMSLILLVGLTAGVLLLVSHMEAEQQAEEARIEEAKVLFSMNSNDIDRIEITTADGEYHAYLDENSQWTLENEVDFEINTYYLNSITSQLSALTALDIICPVSEADPAEYGLDDPVVITMYTGDTAHTLNVGKLGATEEFYYVTVEGRDEIFSVSVDYADYLDISKNSLKSIYILRNSDSAINSVSLEAHGEAVYEIEMNSDGLWSMTTPISIEERIDTSGVSSLLTTIRQMIVDKFGEEYVTEEQYAEYGFDSPEYVFSFTQDNGEATTLLVQDYNLDDTVFVSLLCKETGQIFYMESTYTSFLQDGAEQFIQDIIYSCASSEIDTIEIQWNERENADITIDDENGAYTLNGTALEDISADAVASLDDFYTKIQALKFDTFCVECPVDKDAAPDITIIYTLKDGTATEVSFRETEDENLAVFVDGEYSYFTISKKNFTARDGIYDYYDQLLDAAGLD